MWGFSVGIFSFAVAVLIPLIYVISRGLDWFGATINRTEKPKDMMMVKVVLGIIIGFILGSIIQYFWDTFTACKESGYPLLQCFSKR
ncbi:hypothetical protein U0L13_000577 [Providencia stuartii]|uniref:hypothetical protein n=1 Tax=Providencia stuartii TaxID=588 RepID=UPI001FF6D088|nr:hypothetical protein [Providencia stuartii]ELZ5938423.1 hypothetical protein [Providencia stuartii]MCK1142479.1 hypothetical protein [Providencia stuartii]